MKLWIETEHHSTRPFPYHYILHHFNTWYVVCYSLQSSTLISFYLSSNYTHKLLCIQHSVIDNQNFIVSSSSNTASKILHLHLFQNIPINNSIYFFLTKRMYFLWSKIRLRLLSAFQIISYSCFSHQLSNWHSQLHIAFLESFQSNVKFYHIRHEALEGT